jgi:hypothetical protein
MRRFILATIGLLALSIPGFAQEYVYPKAEVFGGFSIGSMGSGASRQTLLGWQSAVHGNFHQNIGFTADLGGQYKSIAGVGVNSHQFLFGPRVFVRRAKVTPYAHSLFGATRASAAGISNTGFGMGIGGGLDVNASDRLSIRVAQVDWTPTRFSGVWSKSEYRIGIGVVWKSGE